jgi:hypothetical protein
MSPETKSVVVVTVYLTLVMILVSLDSVYGITNNIFGKLIGAPDQVSYGIGMNFNQRGFILHIIVFALLVALPMIYMKQ